MALKSVALSLGTAAIGIAALLVYSAWKGQVMTGVTLSTGLLGVWVLLSIVEFQTWDATYVATDKKVLRYTHSFLQENIEGITWESVDSIEVDNGWTDTLFDTGTVQLDGRNDDDVSLIFLSNADESQVELENLR